MNTERTLALPLQDPLTNTVCWGSVPERGLRDTTGRFLLDRQTDDRLLAARVVHLRLHSAPVKGPGCSERLLDEEVRGWSAELAEWRRLGVTDPSLELSPNTSDLDLRSWLLSASPTATRLRRSHQARCR